MEISKNIATRPAGSTIKRKYSPSFYIHSAGLFLMIVLWSYAVFVKVADWQLYTRQTQAQPFSPAIKLALTFAIPIFEGIAGLLLILKFRLLGLWISLILLLGFTLYVILVLARFFPLVPCSCGGLISRMSWRTHLWFNLAFIFVIIHSFWFELKKKGGSLAEKK